MTTRRATFVGAVLLAAVLSTSAVSSADAATVETTGVVHTATTCHGWVVKGKKWLTKVGKPTSSNNWKYVRKRIDTQTANMWNGPTRQAGLKISSGLKRACS
jgi:hypothetical protein